MSQIKDSGAGSCRKFGIIDKLAYAAGDFGCNCSFFFEKLSYYFLDAVYGN